MKPKTLMLMGVAIVCGLVASYMTSRLIAEKNETVKVLVPNKDIPEWTPVRTPETMFVEKDVPKNQAPPTYIPPSAIGEMKDRLLIKKVRKDEPVTWESLQSKDKMGLEALLPAGKRAFAIETSARTAAGGFILPGSHVDIILVSRGQIAGDSKYVLEDVLVRAIDLLPVRPDDKPGLVPSTITLELTPEEALKLSKIVQQGQLMLTLRPPDDKKKYSETVAVAPPPPPPIPEPVDVGTPDKPMEKPKFVVKHITGFDGTRWVRTEYRFDLNGNLMGPGKTVPLDPEDKGGDSGAAPATPATPEAESELPTPGVSN
jgi:pilus assembly protein CpaB